MNISPSSPPDEDKTYRDWQQSAKKHRLPCNFKADVLRELVKAKKEGNEELVVKIISQQKARRIERKKEKKEVKKMAKDYCRMIEDLNSNPNLRVNNFSYLPPPALSERNSCMPKSPPFPPFSPYSTGQRQPHELNKHPCFEFVQKAGKEEVRRPPETGHPTHFSRPPAPPHPPTNPSPQNSNGHNPLNYSQMLRNERCGNVPDISRNESFYPDCIPSLRNENQTLRKDDITQLHSAEPEPIQETKKSFQIADLLTNNPNVPRYLVNDEVFAPSSSSIQGVGQDESSYNPLGRQDSIRPHLSHTYTSAPSHYQAPHYHQTAEDYTSQTLSYPPQQDPQQQLNSFPLSTHQQPLPHYPSSIDTYSTPSHCSFPFSSAYPIPSYGQGPSSSLPFSSHNFHYPPPPHPPPHYLPTFSEWRGNNFDPSYDYSYGGQDSYYPQNQVDCNIPSNLNQSFEEGSSQSSETLSFNGDLSKELGGVQENGETQGLANLGPNPCTLQSTHEMGGHLTETYNYQSAPSSTVCDTMSNTPQPVSSSFPDKVQVASSEDSSSLSSLDSQDSDV